MEKLEIRDSVPAEWGQRIRESCLSLNSGDGRPYGFLDALQLAKTERQ